MILMYIKADNGNLRTGKSGRSDTGTITDIILFLEENVYH